MYIGGITVGSGKRKVVADFLHFHIGIGAVGEPDKNIHDDETARICEFCAFAGKNFQNIDFFAKKGINGEEQFFRMCFET